MGMMVKHPYLKIEVTPANQLTIVGRNCPLIRKIVAQWFQAFHYLVADYADAKQLPVRINLVHSPPRHAGFGSGTQLAFSIASILFRWFDIEVPSANEIAIAMSRGKRSAIGSYGFFQGGVLVDRGISTHQSFSPLEFRFPFPDQWKVILITPKNHIGVHGALENKSFRNLSLSTSFNRERLVQLCSDCLVPAITQKDYALLGNALHEFNRLSGQYFSEHQHGCWHSETCSRIVSDILSLGISAVGQSSWGPTLFCIVEDETRAHWLIKELSRRKPELYSADEVAFLLTDGDNKGALVSDGC